MRCRSFRGPNALRIILPVNPTNSVKAFMADIETVWDGC